MVLKVMMIIKAVVKFWPENINLQKFHAQHLHAENCKHFGKSLYEFGRQSLDGIRAVSDKKSSKVIVIDLRVQ